LVVVGIVFFHASANVLNDFFDVRYRVDQEDSPTARYRPQPLLTGLLTPRQLLAESMILFAVACLIGLLLAYHRSVWILWIGILGFLLGVFYTAGPVKYKYRALGEFAVFLIWGPLMIQGAYLAQRQVLSLQALFVSVPFGIFVGLVLLANNLRDIDYDSRLNVKTMGILLGSRRGFLLYTMMLVTAYLYTIGMAVSGVLSAWTLLVLLSLPSAFGLLRSFKGEMPQTADAITAKQGSMFGVLFIIALVLTQMVPL
jgi:1,4-dihydroxy-2-naphthoate octaprenyltransferase